jgi:hypothetical protein
MPKVKRPRNVRVPRKSRPTKKAKQKVYKYRWKLESTILTKQGNWPCTPVFAPERIKLVHGVVVRVATDDEEWLTTYSQKSELERKRIAPLLKRQGEVIHGEVILVDGSSHLAKWNIDKWIVLRPCVLGSRHYTLDVLHCFLCRSTKTCTQCLMFEGMGIKDAASHYHTLCYILPNVCLVEVLETSTSTSLGFLPVCSPSLKVKEAKQNWVKIIRCVSIISKPMKEEPISESKWESSTKDLKDFVGLKKDDLQKLRQSAEEAESRFEVASHYEGPPVSHDETPTFQYENKLDREYETSKCVVKSVEFPLGLYAKCTTRLDFENFVTEKEAIKSVEHYLSQPLTKRYYDLIRHDLFSADGWEVNQWDCAYRGDVLRHKQVISVYLNDGGHLTLFNA